MTVHAVLMDSFLQCEGRIKEEVISVSACMKQLAMKFCGTKHTQNIIYETNNNHACERTLS